IDQGAPTTVTTPDWFVAAQPINDGNGHAILSLIASRPTSAVTKERDDLFRTLFAIALGGPLLALIVAAFVGDRIGSGLRRWTAAAEGIRRGDLQTRTQIHSDDEIGVLGSAFDSMAESIEDKTEAEARLRD